MDIHASLRFLRMAPRKVRLVVDTVRGLPVAAAETRLSFLNKEAARPVLKLLRSAIANAEHNFHVQKDTLAIKAITADGGPTLKRSRARAFGRSAPIRKRTTHVSIVLTDEQKQSKSPPKADAPMAQQVKSQQSQRRSKHPAESRKPKAES